MFSPFSPLLKAVELTKTTSEVEKGAYKYKYSNCPLVSEYVSKSKNKDQKEFFIPLF
mgnify:CR=1 FL=1